MVIFKFYGTQLLTMEEFDLDETEEEVLAAADFTDFTMLLELLSPTHLAKEIDGRKVNIKVVLTLINDLRDLMFTIVTNQMTLNEKYRNFLKLGFKTKTLQDMLERPVDELEDLVPVSMFA